MNNILWVIWAIFCGSHEHVSWPQIAVMLSIINIVYNSYAVCVGVRVARIECHDTCALLLHSFIVYLEWWNVAPVLVGFGSRKYKWCFSHTLALLIRSLSSSNKKCIKRYQWSPWQQRILVYIWYLYRKWRQTMRRSTLRDNWQMWSTHMMS